MLIPAVVPVVSCRILLLLLVAEPAGLVMWELPAVVVLVVVVVVVVVMVMVVVAA